MNRGSCMKKYLGKIISVLFVLLAMGMTVCAADADNIENIEIRKNQVYQVNSDAELHEQPDASSAVTAVLPGGTPVIVREDAQGGWCLVAYQEQEGYVQVSVLGLLGSVVTPAGQETAESGADSEATESGTDTEDANALDEEFRNVQEADMLAYQEAEAAKLQAASKKRWGVVIAVLVIAIFAVGITTALTGSKGNKKRRS